MAKIIKTSALVVLLTGLIWAWAEQSQIATLKEQPLELRVQVPANSQVVLSRSTGAISWGVGLQIPATASFTGPQGSISELARMIERQEYPPPFILPLPRDGAEEIDLDLADVLKSQPMLTQMHTGVSVVRPESVKVRLARLAEFKLDVVPTYSDLVTRPADCKPDKVTVLLPRAVYDKLDKKVIRPVVQVNATTDLTRPIVVQLPLDLAGYPIQPQPRTVTVITNVGMTEHRVENVPVLASFPRDFPVADYELVSEKDQWRKTVVARGPADRTLTAADIQVYLRFEPNDTKDPAQLSRDVEIILPPGFELVSPKPKEADRAVNFSFEKRSKERTGS